MASPVSTSVSATASRFAVLQVESNIDSEPGKGRRGQVANKRQASEPRPATSEKKKRSEKKEQQQSETNEVCESVENTSPQSKIVNKKEKKNWQGKRQPLTVPLKDFQSDSNTDHIAKKHEEWDLRDGRIERLKFEREKKDAEIEQLKNVITQWEAKCKEVKARNAMLLKIMQEVNDKVEMLLEVDESQVIENEMTLQVTRLHTALEQERSKVKLLQAELSKYQRWKKWKTQAEPE